MQLRVGSGLPNIQKKSLENLKIALPDYKTQKHYEQILDIIDNKKETERALLIHFQSLKKYLLSKMFI